MKNEIDYKKLESCMIELFGQKDLDIYNKNHLLSCMYISTGGVVINIYSTAPPDYNAYKDTVRVDRLIDKSVKSAFGLKNVREGGHYADYVELATHPFYIVYSIALYITKYVIGQEDDVDETVKEVSNYLRVRVRGTDEEKENEEKDRSQGTLLGQNLIWIMLVNNFITMTKMCRISYDPAKSHDLNIESYYPLTYGQRKFFLEIIEGHNISPDRIFIDDHSKEHCIRRQLGLHFFK